MEANSYSEWTNRLRQIPVKATSPASPTSLQDEHHQPVLDVHGGELTVTVTFVRSVQSEQQSQPFEQQPKQQPEQQLK